MQRRKKRKREKASSEGQTGMEPQPAAAEPARQEQQQAGAEDAMAASDLLAPLQVHMTLSGKHTPRSDGCCTQCLCH